MKEFATKDELQLFILNNPLSETERGLAWKLLLSPAVSSSHYISLIKKQRSSVYDKIRSDTFRTLATSKKFKERVKEDGLIRILNAFAWDQIYSFSYVQGMNVLLAPFLYSMDELTCFFCYKAFVTNNVPLYVQPTLYGVHVGLKLLDCCLELVEPEIFSHLKSKSLTVMTLCACTPPLDEVLKLWDFYIAFGAHLNILCIAAQLSFMRDDLLKSESPMKLLRTFPSLNARQIINKSLDYVSFLSDVLYDQLKRHAIDKSVGQELGMDLFE